MLLRMLLLLGVVGLFAAAWTGDREPSCCLSQRTPPVFDAVPQAATDACHATPERRDSRDLARFARPEPPLIDESPSALCLVSVEDDQLTDLPSVSAWHASAPPARLRALVEIVPATRAGSRRPARAERVAPQPLPAILDSDIPLPLGIAPGEYRIVSSAGEVYHFNLDAGDLECYGLDGGSTQCELYVVSGDDVQWHYIRVSPAELDRIDVNRQLARLHERRFESARTAITQCQRLMSGLRATLAGTLIRGRSLLADAGQRVLNFFSRLAGRVVARLRPGLARMTQEIRFSVKRISRASRLADEPAKNSRL